MGNKRVAYTRQENGGWRSVSCMSAHYSAYACWHQHNNVEAVCVLMGPAIEVKYTLSRRSLWRCGEFTSPSIIRRLSHGESDRCLRLPDLAFYSDAHLLD